MYSCSSKPKGAGSWGSGSTTLVWLPFFAKGVEMAGKTLYVGRAQKKAERQQELKKKFEMLKLERLNRLKKEILNILLGSATHQQMQFLLVQIWFWFNWAGDPV
jgi:hypothetical protein